MFWGVVGWYDFLGFNSQNFFQGKTQGKTQQSVVSSCCLLSDLFLRWTVSSCPSPAPLLVSFIFSFDKAAQAVEVVLALAVTCLHILLHNR